MSHGDGTRPIGLTATQRLLSVDCHWLAYALGQLAIIESLTWCGEPGRSPREHAPVEQAAAATCRRSLDACALGADLRVRPCSELCLLTLKVNCAACPVIGIDARIHGLGHTPVAEMPKPVTASTTGLKGTSDIHRAQGSWRRHVSSAERLSAAPARECAPATQSRPTPSRNADVHYWADIDRFAAAATKLRRLQRQVQTANLVKLESAAAHMECSLGDSSLLVLHPPGVTAPAGGLESCRGSFKGSGWP